MDFKPVRLLFDQANIQQQGDSEVWIVVIPLSQDVDGDWRRFWIDAEVERSASYAVSTSPRAVTIEALEQFIGDAKHQVQARTDYANRQYVQNVLPDRERQEHVAASEQQAGDDAADRIKGILESGE